MTNPPERSQVIVMTGATSGIGAAALRQLAADPNKHIIIGARGNRRAVPPGVHVLPLDLTSLTSVRDFAEAVLTRLDGGGIDALVLNAGTQSRDPKKRTAEGFEVTFAVNHLAHYLLARLLTPHLADNATVILTTSDTHDPAIMPLAPRSLDLEQLAHPTRSGFAAGMRAYTASKLCNLLTARSLDASTELRWHGVRAIAFNPGFTGGTNLGDPSPTQRRLMQALAFPVIRLIGRINPVYAMGTPQRAGEVLAGLVAGTITPPQGLVYASIVNGQLTYPSPSSLALNNPVRDQVWRTSATMVGLTSDTTNDGSTS